MVSLYITGFKHNPDGSMTLHTQNMATGEPQDITVDKEMATKIQETSELIYDAMGNSTGIRAKSNTPIVDIKSIPEDYSKLEAMAFKELEARYGRA